MVIADFLNSILKTIEDRVNRSHLTEQAATVNPELYFMSVLFSSSTIDAKDVIKFEILSAMDIAINNKF